MPASFCLSYSPAPHPCPSSPSPILLPPLAGIGKDKPDNRNRYMFIIDWVLTHIPPWVFIALVAHLVVLGSVAYLILLERKVASWAQDRIGPNRVGPKGLLQPIADGVKFILKEDYRPAGADKY